MRALTFKQLQKVIGCAGDKKLTEVRLCLEGLSLVVPESLDIKMPPSANHLNKCKILCGGWHGRS